MRYRASLPTMKSSTPNHCVLCGTDFSERAQRAAGVAAKLAARNSQGLLLAHVTQTPAPDLLGFASQRLQAESAQLASYGATIEPLLVKESPVAKALLGLIDARKPSLIVVAAGTKGAVDRWALGSVSEEIAESAPAPTLIVRNPVPFETWDWAGSTLRVLAAVDFYSSSDGVLRWVKELRRLAPCDVLVCHANSSLWARTRAELEDAPAEPVNGPELQARLERELKKKARDQLGEDGWPVAVRARFGDPESTILQLAHDHKADLVVVGTHQRHGASRLLHGSVSRGVLRRASTNVACVPTTLTFDPHGAHIPEYRRVLVATDFSELGNAAVPFACGACAIGGLVKIVHVFSPSREHPYGTELVDLHRRLRGLIPDEIGARAQPPEVAVLIDSDPDQAICREADSFGADLVCLASHGFSGSRALFGSITQGVLARIRRPLLLLRRPDE